MNNFVLFSFFFSVPPPARPLLCTAAALRSVHAALQQKDFFSFFFSLSPCSPPLSLRDINAVLRDAGQRVEFGDCPARCGRARRQRDAGRGPPGGRDGRSVQRANLPAGTAVRCGSRTSRTRGARRHTHRHARTHTVPQSESKGRREEEEEEQSTQRERIVNDL